MIICLNFVIVLLNSYSFFLINIFRPYDKTKLCLEKF